MPAPNSSNPVLKPCWQIPLPDPRIYFASQLCFLWTETRSEHYPLIPRALLVNESRDDDVRGDGLKSIFEGMYRKFYKSQGQLLTIRMTWP